MERHKLKTKTCPICNVLFETYHNGHKYCSDQCRLIATKQMRATSYQNRRVKNYNTCKQCGKIFVITTYNVTYCSVDCMNIYKESHKKPEYVERFCIACGAKVITKNRNRKYCENCVETQLKERKKQWYQDEYKDIVLLRNYEQKQATTHEKLTVNLSAQEIREENERQKILAKQQRAVLRQKQAQEKQERNEIADYNKIVSKYKISRFFQRCIMGGLESGDIEAVYNIIDKHFNDNHISHNIKEIYDLISGDKSDIINRIYKYILSEMKGM